MRLLFSHRDWIIVLYLRPSMPRMHEPYIRYVLLRREYFIEVVRTNRRVAIVSLAPIAYLLFWPVVLGLMMLTTNHFSP